MKKFLKFLPAFLLANQIVAQSFSDTVPSKELDEFVLKAIRVTENSPVAHEDILKEELEFTNGQFPQKNFNEYKMLRLKDAPKIEIELIETGGQPVGLGEPATTTVAPAVANAIFDAVGIRVKKLPIRPDDIRNQLSS